MRSEPWEGKIIPAQLSFLAIYSPPLGTSDETFKDQVVFYYSRAAKEAKSLKKGRKATKGAEADDEAFATREEENEKLRQIGLAQGMVDFARSFSGNQAVDSVETEKSRIILHELEHGWWLLASIDLTRLPSLSPASTRTQDAPGSSKIEYSSREVSPAPLLLAQVLAANRTFLLHHGPTISDLYIKVSRDKFCGILDRFWGRFCRNWEVLLHGNPAVEVFGGVKLAAGGELGVGVGEEDWGSGEREVLEDLVRQTDGLVDLTVSRFGQAAPPEADNAFDDPSEKTLSDAQAGLPWLGSGNLPDASDGVIFGGTGAIARSSLRDVSSWVQEVYTYGEFAYGVKDNPQRQRRKRRKRQPPTMDDEQPLALRRQAHKQSYHAPKDEDDLNREQELDVPLPHDPRPQIHDRIASHDRATGAASPQLASHPGIPPPIVSAAEESLNAASRAAAASPGPDSAAGDRSGSRFGISNKWMGYLTLGLSNVGGNGSRSSSPDKRPTAPRRTSSSSSRTIRASTPKGEMRHSKEPDIPEGDEEQSAMQTLDPAPDGYEVTAQIDRQRRHENIGHFLIGYQGDLEEAPRTLNGPDVEGQDAEVPQSDGEGSRQMLRTLQVELVPEKASPSDDTPDDASDIESLSQEPLNPNHQRLRVLVYIHRPFVYTFLFAPRAHALQMSSFYTTLHAHLRPLHKPLLRSTSLQQVALRIADAHANPTSPSDVNSEAPPFQPPKSSPVFDLVHDPVTLTTHTSIPNIPDPGTPAAEGFATTSTGRKGPPLWTRIEAINVHSQILSTLAATKPNKLETERTSKTSRGWWVVWLRIPGSPAEEGVVASGRDDYDDCRTAFLVRKASDGLVGARGGGLGGGGGGGGTGGGSRVGSGMSNLSMGLGMGMFGFGAGSPSQAEEEREDREGKAVGWGLGIDARKYVEGLLSLNR